MNHVLAEMKLLLPLLSAVDYLIVEDSNLNGDLVFPGSGPGLEAIEAYEHESPNAYSIRGAGQQFRLHIRAQRILIRNWR